MARKRYRKNQGLIEMAATSDWTYGAFLAGACVVGAVSFIPALFASSPMLQGLSGIFTLLAWFMAFLFGSISLVRFFRQSASTMHVATATTQGALRGADPVRRETPPSVSRDVVERPESWSLDVIDRIEWKRFEDLCCEFYREKGIRAETTPLGADGGVDIRLFQDETDPTRATVVVQCKALSKQVGVATVRELRGVMAHEKVEKAFFMAPNGFTDDARAFATANRITLLDGKLFLAMLQRLPEESSKRLLSFATEGDWTVPTCPACGVKMAYRDSRRGPFWACSTYPRCKTTMPMRASARQAR